MKFSLLILGAPYSSQACGTALRFARAVVASGHEISRVFFFDDGTYVASSLIVSPQDEANPGEAWQQFAAEHQLDMVTCVSSALKRGILDDTEAERYEKPASNLLDEFEISGLGQLIDAALQSDRLITFGS